MRSITTTQQHGEIIMKTKAVLGLSMVVALFAFTATPALARWTNHGGKGAGHSGEGTLTYEGGIIKCATAEGSYKVNSEGTVLTLEGIKWNKCKALSLEATVTCASLEMKQPTKEGTEKGKAKGSQVSSVCVVKAPGCEISIPTEGNKELETISMKKAGANIEASVEVKGITATAKGTGCALGGISKEKTTSATEKVGSLIGEGVGLE
jgi:hypothetical protein